MEKILQFFQLKLLSTKLTFPLKYLFNLSLDKGVFPEDITVTKVTPSYNFNSSDVSNHRPISVLPCFSKMLEKIMYNFLKKIFKESKYYVQ